MSSPAGADAPGPLPAPLPGPLAAGLVFLASAAVLVLEVLSLRLVAPYVGLTLQTSTAVIGTALAAIALGAWAGGRVADLVAPRALLGPVLVVAGLATLLVLPLVRWAGRVLIGAGGAPAASTVLLLALSAVFVPAALLSAVTPLVVKLQLANLAVSGSVVGRYSGIGTLGAIVATFTTGFLLVAALPTSVIVGALGGLLVTVGLGTAWVTGRRGAGRVVRTGGAVLAAAALGAGLTLTAPAPCEVETAYHCAEVVPDPRRPTGRVLKLDTLRHSYVDVGDPTHLEFRYVQAIASLADVLRPPGRPVRALHLGGGGATLPRYLAATRPGSASTVLEIDAGVVDLGERRLGLAGVPGVRLEVADARLGLAAAPAGGYDLVVGDAFGGVAVPWHLTTLETVAGVDRALGPDGVYAVNVVDFPPLRFARAEVATLRARFPHVVLAADPGALSGRSGGNLVLLASRAPLPLGPLRERLAARGTGWAVAEEAETARFAGDAAPLSDDFAPVDQLISPR